MLFTVVATMAFETVSYNLSGAFSIATFLPGVAVTARRLHDTDRSGWWQLLYFLPIIGWIVLALLALLALLAAAGQRIVAGRAAAESVQLR